MKFLADIDNKLKENSYFLFNVSNKLYFMKNHCTFSIYEDEQYYFLDFINIKYFNLSKYKTNLEEIQNIYDCLFELDFIQEKFKINI